MSSPGPDVEFARALARKAREDLDALRVLHASTGIADAVIGFHAQQAVEKALKATLVASGREVRRTHDLRFLLDEVADAGVELTEDVASSAWLTPWAVELRYDEFLEETLDRDGAVAVAEAAVALAARLVP